MTTIPKHQGQTWRSHAAGCVSNGDDRTRRASARAGGKIRVSARQPLRNLRAAAATRSLPSLCSRASELMRSTISLMFSMALGDLLAAARLLLAAALHVLR